ncbi:glycosyltransferase, partial [Amycolatopsis sp. H20-H5]|uniref:glycosyltransferase n=1 Tax=Amycolatopsis sp. H20-H5 TaxID=3046309 RepID=UPI002DBA2C74
MPEVQGVVVDPSGALISDGVLTARRIPQVALLRHAAVVVCHGGHNTVCEALGDGVPLVVAPIRDDQSMLAHQVVAASAGVRLRFDRATAADIRAAIAVVLAEPSYAAAADTVRASFAAAGGAPAAATHLEALAVRARLTADVL